MGVLNGLGLSVATLPSLAAFTWKSEAQRKRDRYGGRGGYSSADDEWDLEARQSRSTSPKYILPSFMPSKPFDGTSTLFGKGDSNGGTGRSNVVIHSFKDNSDHDRRGTRKRADWRRALKGDDDEDEMAAWVIVFMLVVAVMAMAGLSSILSGPGEANTAGLANEKVVGWGRVEGGGKKWHVRREFQGHAGDDGHGVELTCRCRSSA